MAAKINLNASEVLKPLTYPASALNAPRITEAASRLADHSRDAGCTHEGDLAAVPDDEVTARKPPQPDSASVRVPHRADTTSPLRADHH